MHLLVTGAAGFLGGHVVRAALDAGHRVRAADLPGAVMPDGAEPFPLDVRDEARVADAVRDADVVVHAAGIFDFSAAADRMRAVNVEGARTVARHARGRLVLVSSSSVYGHAGVNAAEDAPKRPRNAYEQTKWDGEREATETCGRRGVPVAALRPTLIYGPAGRYGLSVWLAQLALRKAHGLRRLPVIRGGWKSHHVHVADVAAAALLLATHPDASGPYNVADERPLATDELLRVVAESAGLAVRELPVPWLLSREVLRHPWLLRRVLASVNPRMVRAWERLVQRQGLVLALTPRLDDAWVDYLAGDHSYDTSRLRALGFRPVWPDLRAGLASTVEWYRQARWLPR